MVVKKTEPKAPLFVGLIILKSCIDVESGLDNETTGGTRRERGPLGLAGSTVDSLSIFVKWIPSRGTIVGEIGGAW